MQSRDALLHLQGCTAEVQLGAHSHSCCCGHTEQEPQTQANTSYQTWIFPKFISEAFSPPFTKYTEPIKAREPQPPLLCFLPSFQTCKQQRSPDSIQHSSPISAAPQISAPPSAPPGRFLSFRNMRARLSQTLSQAEINQCSRECLSVFCSAVSPFR